MDISLDPPVPKKKSFAMYNSVLTILLSFFHLINVGMTETCSSLTFMTIYDPTMKTYSQHHQTVANIKYTSVHQPQGVCVGKPAPHVELKICVDGSSPVGKILTRGPHLMLRYWGEIPAKAAYSSNESWFDTGDVGSIDEYGNVWLIGRAKGQIKSGGENIYPEEVA